MTDMDFIVSAGHAEYSPLENAVPDLTITTVWDLDYDDTQFEGKDIWDFTDEELVERFKAENDGKSPPDADLHWEMLVRWEGDRPAVEAGLQSLIEQINTEPSGDDDTFDYWPSGVRYALAVAKQLGGDWPDKVSTVAKEIIEFKGNLADELLDKVGLKEEEGDA